MSVCRRRWSFARALRHLRKPQKRKRRRWSVRKKRKTHEEEKVHEHYKLQINAATIS